MVKTCYKKCNKFIKNNRNMLLMMQPKVCGWIIAVLIFFELEPSGGHEIVNLVVPILADPRENATLSCQYRMGSDHLYSAKWFKEDKEIYRYMPGMTPPGLHFPVVGVKLAREPHCSVLACDLELTELNLMSAGMYRCEVSTEAPTFRIVNKSSNMTIAALPQKDPKLVGFSPSYSLGHDIRVNCSSDPSLPLSEISWYVNDKEASFLTLEGPWISRPDHRGLASQTLGLHLRAERPLFASGALRIRCLASLPPLLPGGLHTRETVATATLFAPGFLTNEKLAWPGSEASRSLPKLQLIIVYIFMSFLMKTIFMWKPYRCQISSI